MTQSQELGPRNRRRYSGIRSFLDYHLDDEFCGRPGLQCAPLVQPATLKQLEIASHQAEQWLEQYLRGEQRGNKSTAFSLAWNAHGIVYSLISSNPLWKPQVMENEGITINMCENPVADEFARFVLGYGIICGSGNKDLWDEHSLSVRAEDFDGAVRGEKYNPQPIFLYGTALGAFDALRDIERAYTQFQRGVQRRMTLLDVLGNRIGES